MRTSRKRFAPSCRQAIITLLCLLALPLLSGCPYESGVPLGQASDAKIDGSLIGRWKYADKKSGEVGVLTISRFNDTELLVTVAGDAGQEPDMMRGFVTVIDGKHFLNLQEMKGAYADRKWMFATYVTGACSLAFSLANDSLISAGAENGLTIQQTSEPLRKHLGDKKIYDGETSLTCVKK
jgi:hypothetical protein